jgi:hypothetical protein
LGFIVSSEARKITKARLECSKPHALMTNAFVGFIGMFVGTDD